MNALRAIIVDDEPLAREAIAALLESEPDIQVVGEAADGPSAIEAIRREKPGLVFLDVQIPGYNGFEVIEELEPEERPAIVFVTAYDREAIRAFELSAVDYLLKPLNDERFRMAVERARTRIRRAGLDDEQARLRRLLEHALGAVSPRPAEPPGRPAKLGFKIGADYHLVDAAEVVWIEAQGDFVKIAAGGQVHRVREALLEVEKRLDPGTFSRVHRSFVVNVDRIRKVTTGLGGEFILLMSDGTKIPVSRSRRSNVSALLG
ncbi:MAG: LytR/AlgR family response regulator transcription factor [Opitutaceae bacterium]